MTRAKKASGKKAKSKGKVNGKGKAKGKGKGVAKAFEKALEAHPPVKILKVVKREYDQLSPDDKTALKQGLIKTGIKLMAVL